MKGGDEIEPRSDRVAALHALEILDIAPDPAFDDIALLASQLCDAPVALVSLVDTDRQWFAARLGFADCQTDLDRSVCRFVVAAGETIVIPDLAADPRTRDNPLVTGDAAIRFYAGAPLVTADGHVLGALCVIDHIPRAAGLTGRQQGGLEALARRTVEVIELRRLGREHRAAVIARDRADAERFDVERRWQRLFHNFSEGFVLAHVVRDAGGAVVDWRFEAVNDAWYELFGVPHGSAVGRTFRELLPTVDDDWVVALAQVVATDRPVRFTREVAAFGRWYEGVAQPAGDDRFTVVFIDVSERIARDRRQDALLHLGDRLRDETSIDELSAAASAVLGEMLDVELVGYGEVDPDAETITVTSDWTTRGALSLAGTLQFRDYGSYIEDLKAGRTVVVTDCRRDPRTRDHAAALEERSARAFVNTPVFERGSFVGLLYVSTGRPRDWTADELGFIRDVASRLRLATARIQAEERQAILNGEIAHRLKNSLSMVQAIATQTFRKLVDRAALNTFSNRLQALGTAHDALLGRDLQAADLNELIALVLAAAGVGDRYHASGPGIRLGPRTALSASLLLHELATNAMKYGALSTDDGRVDIAWRVEGAGATARLVLDWREHGGPPAAPPNRQGFGSRLLKLGLVGVGDGEINYGPQGFSGAFTALTHHLEH